MKDLLVNYYVVYNLMAWDKVDLILACHLGHNHLELVRHQLISDNFIPRLICLSCDGTSG